MSATRLARETWQRVDRPSPNASPGATWQRVERTPPSSPATAVAAAQLWRTPPSSPAITATAARASPARTWTTPTTPRADAAARAADAPASAPASAEFARTRAGADGARGLTARLGEMRHRIALRQLWSALDKAAGRLVCAAWVRLRAREAGFAGFAGAARALEAQFDARGEEGARARAHARACARVRVSTPLPPMAVFSILRGAKSLAISSSP